MPEQLIVCLVIFNTGFKQNFLVKALVLNKSIKLFSMFPHIWPFIILQYANPGFSAPNIGLEFCIMQPNMVQVFCKL